MVADLPVGENLQDQVIGDGISFYTSYSGVSVTVAKSENFHSAWIYSLFGTGTGNIPCAYCNGASVLSYISIIWIMTAREIVINKQRCPCRSVFPWRYCARLYIHIQLDY